MSTTSDSHSHVGTGLHDACATTYDRSGHSSFIQTIPKHLAKLPPNARILDLACGTALDTFALAAQFQDVSSIIGVDKDPGMLDEARTKLSQAADEGVQIEFYEHDISDLDSLAAIQNSAFDVIACVSAFVILPDPHKALAHWCRYLAPGGMVVLRTAHPQSLIAGMALEHTASKLNVSIPCYRSWISSEKSLRDAFEKADLEVLSIKLEQQQDGVPKFHGTDDQIVNTFLEAQMRTSVADTFHAEAENRPDLLDRAREVFHAEWATQASHRSVEEVDDVWVGIARKPASSVASTIPVNQPKMTGGCRCSAVRYEAYRRPTGILVCHCSTCGRLSGAGNIPYVDIPTNSFRYVESRGLKTLRLSDVASRTFCTECGSPITLVFDGTEGYEDQKGKTNIVLGSVDIDSLSDEVPKVSGHIYVGEKCVWEILPDDGAQRMRKLKE